MNLKIFLQILMICLFISCNNLNSNKVNTEASAAKSDSLITDSTTGVDYLDIGFKFMDSETIGGIKRGLAFENVKALLGEPENISNIDTSQVDGGLYQSIEYPKLGVNIVLSAHPDSVKRVENIFISEPCSLKTSKQIGIGSSMEEVKKAYGELINPNELSDEYITVGTVYGGIVFNFEKLKVKSIYIGITAD